MLQGARDYQVATEEFKMWQVALSSRPNVQLKLYSTLNHLFMGSVGKSKPAEYAEIAHLAKIVIDDIAVWLKKH